MKYTLSSFPPYGGKKTPRIGGKLTVFPPLGGKRLPFSGGKKCNLKVCTS